ncbi:MAG: CapA family protein [Armatimonadetes bacterium]|nr:CapA family protein [Armatimonadota bacterium]
MLRAFIFLGLMGTIAEAAIDTWTLVAGGDLMLNGIAPKTNPLKGIAPIFRAGDIAYANLEIPITNSKTVTSRKSKKDLIARNQFVLRADPGHIAGLAGMGLDAVSLANNHAMDFGWGGVTDMQKSLTRKDIRFAGAGSTLAEAEICSVVQVKGGPRVGFVSFLAFMGDKALWTCSPATAKAPGIATLAFHGTLDKVAKKRVEEIVAGAKKNCDVLVVALHWGIERQTAPSGYQVQLGRLFIDSGADVILGAHPHVLQGSEVYKGKPICYSLGNLISPLPAATAIHKLTFSGTKFMGLQRLGCSISGGKTVLMKGKAAATAAKGYALLDKRVQAVAKSLSKAVGKKLSRRA